MIKSDSDPPPQPKKPPMSPKKRASFRWLICLLALSEGIFAFVVPSEDRVKVVVIFSLLTPFAILTFFYVMRLE